MFPNVAKKQVPFVLSWMILSLSRLAWAQASLSSPPAREGSKPIAFDSLAASDLGIEFVNGSSSEIILERGGKHYLVDTANHTVREVNSAALTADPDPVDINRGHQTPESASSADPGVAGNAVAQSQGSNPTPTDKGPRIYKPGDDMVYTLPTGRRIDRHGLYLNFTHRFPYEPAFTAPGRGNTLLGLDDFAIPSFGLRFGVTSKLSVSAYRSPSLIGRPIEIGVAYNFLDEKDGYPLNAAARVSIDGQNNFATSFTENLELVVSRSLGHRAQLYAVPTFSINDRPLVAHPGPQLWDPYPVQHCYLPLAAGISPSFEVHPCANVFSLGVGASVDIRPTVALVAEAIPTLANGPELGIHRAAFAFGIKKKIWRHAFTLGFGNSPGTNTSQRAGTDATFTANPGADKPSAMFIGFDLTRQIF
ncbi:MAG TPA: DUF5777 family beta-barrel protein [Terriglobales bacterium]|nr:DUF5777 family beta-barrel protein [Terriglobales bacterium]